MENTIPIKCACGKVWKISPVSKTDTWLFNTYWLFNKKGIRIREAQIRKDPSATLSNRYTWFDKEGEEKILNIYVGGVLDGAWEACYVMETSPEIAAQIPILSTLPQARLYSDKYTSVGEMRYIQTKMSIMIAKSFMRDVTFYRSDIKITQKIAAGQNIPIVLPAESLNFSVRDNAEFAIDADSTAIWAAKIPENWCFTDAYNYICTKMKENLFVNVGNN